MTFSIVQIIVGLFALTYGADRFVDGASGIATALKVPTLLIGLTVVAFATSAPELIVSATAAINGNPGLALGNAIGSNIANVALVLGTTALIIPLVVKSSTLNKEFTALWLVILLSVYILHDLQLTKNEGYLMILGLCLFMFWVIVDGLNQSAIQPTDNDSTSITIGAAIFLTLLGLVLLVFGGRWLVDGAVKMAQYFGVSDTVIGLTIVAIGTSLPELAASLAGAIKGKPDIAIGNIIGSNVFNLLGVIGIAGAIAPFSFNQELVLRDFALMCAVTILLFAVLLWQKMSKKTIQLKRQHGIIFLIIYLGYLAYLIMLSQ